ncbi:MAG: hypothetical protein ACHQ53_12420 [Polyangiales bacterium]
MKWVVLALGCALPRLLEAQPASTPEAAAAPAPAVEDTAPDVPTVPAAPVARLMLLPTQSTGIDPIVGRFVDRALRRAAETLGYEVLPPADASAALVQVGAPYPPSMADLWRATHHAGVERGVLAIAWASNGRYMVQIRVASRDGSGPFYAQGDAGSADLEQQVALLLPRALPPPNAAPVTPSAPAAPSPQPAPSAGAAPAPSVKPEAPTAPRFFAGPPPKPAAPYRFRLAVHDDVALGLSPGWFWNDVLGVRIDAQVADATFVGAHLGYADLQGRRGRAHSLLPYVQLEQRIPLHGRALQLPLRFDLGYLVRNGGFLRLSSGLAIALWNRLELVLDLLSPTFWMTPQSSLFSLDLGAELCLTL